MVSYPQEPRQSAAQQQGIKPTAPDGEITPEGVEAAFGEPLEQTLDLATWTPGEDLAALYERLEQTIQEAVRFEDGVRARVRAELFPKVFSRPSVPPGAGIYRAAIETLARIHRGLLFTGQVEACDGISALHDTLPVTIAQIGVCLVSYRGDQGSWVHRLYRRDLRVRGADPIEEALDLLDRRWRRSGPDGTLRDRLTELGRRGIMAYAERAVLLERSTARWRMGHGVPVPTELLTGSGSVELSQRGLELLEGLLLGHRRVIFVPSGFGNRALHTLGHALEPLEIAIVDTLQSSLELMLDQASSPVAASRRVRSFVQEIGPQIVLGLCRASPAAPPCAFYTHADYALEAGHIALADATLQEHRGWPLLLDLAAAVCRATFGTHVFEESVQLAYAHAGEPYRYRSFLERGSSERRLQ
jgi:hypothetical protein